MVSQKILLQAQRNEITEHYIYAHLSKRIKDKNNKKILKRISQDELEHYGIIKKYTKQNVNPSKTSMWYYIILSYIFGLSFSLRLMERGENMAFEMYAKSDKKIFSRMLIDEQRHEQELIGMLQEERLDYAGSIVLGLNDALVELTGALAGFTFALQNATVIAVSGMILGVAAALSMAGSEFLSSREDEGDGKNPMKSAVYTGTAYILTVIVLISPYFIFNNVYYALSTMLSLTLLIIAGYTFYITTAKGLKFTRRFVEMASISIGVAIISFGVGVIARIYFGLEI